jgi:hypothetical protein
MYKPMEPHGFAPQCPHENGDKAWGTVAPMACPSVALSIVEWAKDGFLEIGIKRSGLSPPMFYFVKQYMGDCAAIFRLTCFNKYNNIRWRIKKCC